MKVVLLKPRKKLGNIGDIVQVKTGFGRNYLIPQKIAARATKQNLEGFQDQKHELEKQNEAQASTAKKIAGEISGKDFTFISPSSDDGRLFGSVSAKDIAKQICASAPEWDIDYSKVALQSSIKTLGVYEVTLHLYHEVEAVIIINVGRSENEARQALKNFKSNLSSEQDIAELAIEGNNEIDQRHLES